MIYGVVLAGGKGKRFGKPKQFLEIEGKKLVDYSIDIFLKVVDKILVVLDKEHLDYVEENERVKVILGGKTRGDSLRCAIDHLSTFAEDEDIIVTHDGARPFVTEEIIKRSIDLANMFGASSVGLRVIDTVVKVDGGNVVGSVDRKTVMTVQTPQTAKFKYLKGVDNLGEYTDLCTFLFSKGINVKVFNGDESNVKVTYPEDVKKIIAHIKGKKKIKR